MTKYIVDTNVISEAIKAKPDPAAMEWLSSHAASLCLTSITVEELRFGEFMMPKGKKRKALREWIDSLVQQYAASILDFDVASAEICAKFYEQAISAGFTPTIEDLMIAGIAHENEAVLVTRNVKDFEYLDVEVINPFEM